MGRVYGSVNLSELLLVVHRNAGDLLAGRIGCRGGQGAALTVGSHHDVARGRDLSALFVGDRQVMVGDLSVGPLVGRGIASDGVVLAVELARPLAVDRLAVFVGAVGGDFDAVTRGPR